MRGCVKGMCERVWGLSGLKLHDPKAAKLRQKKTRKVHAELGGGTYSMC